MNHLELYLERERARRDDARVKQLGPAFPILVQEGLLARSKRTTTMAGAEYEGWTLTAGTKVKGARTRIHIVGSNCLRPKLSGVFVEISTGVTVPSLQNLCPQCLIWLSRNHEVLQLREALS